MVTYLQRPGNQAQMSLFTTARRPGDALARGGGAGPPGLGFVLLAVLAG
jgi:hypothetical protein